MEKDKCPKCGGTTGYDFKVIEKQTWVGNWGIEDIEFAEATKSYQSGKTVICADCDKRISLKISIWENKL